MYFQPHPHWVEWPDSLSFTLFIVGLNLPIGMIMNEPWCTVKSNQLVCGCILLIRTSEQSYKFNYYNLMSVF